MKTVFLMSVLMLAVACGKPHNTTINVNTQTDEVTRLKEEVEHLLRVVKQREDIIQSHVKKLHALERSAYQNAMNLCDRFQERETLEEQCWNSPDTRSPWTDGEAAIELLQCLTSAGEETEFI